MVLVCSPAFMLGHYLGTVLRHVSRGSMLLRDIDLVFPPTRNHRLCMLMSCPSCVQFQKLDIIMFLPPPPSSPDLNADLGIIT